MLEMSPRQTQPLFDTFLFFSVDIYSDFWFPFNPIHFLILISFVFQIIFHLNLSSLTLLQSAKEGENNYKPKKCALKCEENESVCWDKKMWMEKINSN